MTEPPVVPRPQRDPFSATGALAYGWGMVRANVGPLAAIVLVLLLVSAVETWLSRGSDSAIGTVAAALASVFISLVIGLGLIRAALTIIDGEHPTVAHLLSAKDLWPYVLASLVVATVVTLGLLLCVLPGILAAYLLQFYGYAIIDRRADSVTTAAQASASGALRASIEVAAGNVGPLLRLAVLCFLVNVVGALLLLVGLLVTLPVTAIAVAYAWRYFTGGPIAPVEA